MLLMRHQSGALSHVQTGFCYSEFELPPVNKEPVQPHTLDIMNACHESQRSGRRIATTTSFPWPVIPAV